MLRLRFVASSAGLSPGAARGAGAAHLSRSSLPFRFTRFL